MPELSEDAKKKIASLEKENQKLEKEVGPLYTVLGKNYYEKPEGYEQEMEKAVGRLDTIKKQIHENRMAILAWKGIRLCPNCGSEVEQGAIFCGECGIRMEAVEDVDENSILCSRCGAKNEKGKKFCVICGQKLVDIIKAVEGDSAQSSKWPEEEPAEAEIETRLVEAEIETRQVEASTLTEDAGMPQENVIFCPECGNRLPADALFCGECGTRIVEEMPLETYQETSAPAGDIPLFCTECGTRLEPGSAFCSECGTPVAAGK